MLTFDDGCSLNIVVKFHPLYADIMLLRINILLLILFHYLRQECLKL